MTLMTSELPIKHKRCVLRPSDPQFWVSDSSLVQIIPLDTGNRRNDPIDISVGGRPSREGRGGNRPWGLS